MTTSTTPRGTLVRQAVDDAVVDQRDRGIDVVSDGEQSKTDFTTYAATRIEGLEHRAGSGPAPTVADRQRRDYPGYFADRPPSRPQMFCTGPLEYVGHDEVRADIENLQRAVDDGDVEEAYLPAVAPATIEHWVVNEHYPDDESYLAALSDVMRQEYEAIVDAGLLLQIDNPDLPDGWGIYTEMDLDEYRRFQWLRVEMLQPRAAEHHARSRAPARVLGAHHGPHDTDIPMGDIIDLVLAVNSVVTRSRQRAPATSTSGRCGRRRRPSGDRPRARCRRARLGHDRASGSGGRPHHPLRTDRRT